MQVLQAVADQQLPDGAVGAGFVRALVWDHLSAQPRTPLDDVDVLYFDQGDLSKGREKSIEQTLAASHSAACHPKVPWSVKNQARMHLRNKTPAAQNTEDAMRQWLETPTAVAARLEMDGEIVILAPFGLVDLFSMVIRPTPAGFEKMDQFEDRLGRKPWLEQWPSLRVDRDPCPDSN